MTPLAHETLIALHRRNARHFTNLAELSDDFSDIHCFEVTEVLSLAGELVDTMAAGDIGLDEYGFLPAPKTWIEWYTRSERMAYLLEELRDNWIQVSLVADSHAGFCSCKLGKIKLTGMTLRSALQSIAPATPSQDNALLLRTIYGILAIINSPKIICRKQNPPTRAHRRFAARHTVAYPLNAWSEIKLQVVPPKDLSEIPAKDVWLTGERAFHFCRAHLRIRYGKLEFVSAHYRGNKALGIKKARYKLMN